MYAFNATDGKELWNYTTEDDYNGIYSSPTYADGKIYAGSSDNKLYCWNASTGEEIWSYKSGGFGEYGCAASATIVSGLLYIGFTGDDTFYCFGDTIIPDIDLNLEIQASDGSQTLESVRAGETVRLEINAKDSELGIENSGIAISADAGVLGEDKGMTDIEGVWSTEYTAPFVSSATQVEVIVNAEAAGYLTNESIFYIDVRLNSALTYEAEGREPEAESLTSTTFAITILDMDLPAANATVELRVTDGKISPISAVTNETGIVNVKFTAPELAVNDTEKKVEILIKIIKPGYEDGKYVKEITVTPLEPEPEAEEEGVDGVMIGLVVVIIILIIVIILSLKLKGKKYW
jgi:hypothetical protein